MFDYSISTTKATAGIYLTVEIEKTDVFKGWFQSHTEAIKEADRIILDEIKKRGIYNV
jgi:hypothetical protein